MEARGQEPIDEATRAHRDRTFETGVDPARQHGGALDAAIRRFGGSRAGWLDLSTGINPSPPPLPDLDPALFRRLPEAAHETEMLAAARRFYGAPDEAGIVAAPGSQALISALPHLLRDASVAQTVAILEPTYGEHRAGFAAAGHRVVGIRDPGELPDAATIAVVVNPNNPDGRVFSRADLLALAERSAQRGGLVIVDEAFADADPSQSLAGDTGRPGLLVHRSFGKFFGLAGIRLGFALTDRSLAASLQSRLGAWAVSGPALAIGAAWLADDDLCADLRASIAAQAVLRQEALAPARLSTVGATALFATVAHPEAGALFEALGRRHILTRPFAGSPTWLRFGNPADAEAAGRLSEALGAALAEIGDRERVRAALDARAR